MRTKINTGAWGLSCIWWILAIVKLIMCHEYRGYMALILGACISALMVMYNYIALKRKNRTIYDQQSHKTFVALGMTKYMSQASKPTKSQQNQQKTNKKNNTLLVSK